jgi:hypothetical protein
MPNVTDSLNFILEYLPELEHELDRACSLAIAAMGHDAESCDAAVTALGTVGGHLRYAIEHLQAEHQALVDVGALFHTQVCEHCGNAFTVTTHGRGPRQWCSQACRQAAYRNRRRALSPGAQVTGG